MTKFFQEKPWVLSCIAGASLIVLIAGNNTENFTQPIDRIGIQRIFYFLAFFVGFHEASKSAHLARVFETRYQRLHLAACITLTAWFFTMSFVLSGIIWDGSDAMDGVTILASGLIFGAFMSRGSELPQGYEKFDTENPVFKSSTGMVFYFGMHALLIGCTLLYFFMGPYARGDDSVIFLCLILISFKLQFYSRKTEGTREHIVSDTVPSLAIFAALVAGYLIAP